MACKFTRWSKQRNGEYVGYVTDESGDERELFYIGEVRMGARGERRRTVTMLSTLSATGEIIETQRCMNFTSAKHLGDAIAHARGFKRRRK